MTRLCKIIACLVAAGVCLVAGCNPPYDNFLRHEGTPHHVAPVNVELPD